MQFEITPDTEVIINCPNCSTALSVHVLDDRIVCPNCYHAYGRDEKTGSLEFAFLSFEGDMVGEKYLRYPPGYTLLNFTRKQYQTIKKLFEAGQIVEAQRVILNILSRR